MDKNASPKADKSLQTSPEAPFTTFIQLDGKSPVPQFRTPVTLRSPAPPAGPGFLTESQLSPVLALLVSISLKSLPSSSYPADRRQAHCHVHRSAVSLQCH